MGHGRLVTIISEEYVRYPGISAICCSVFRVLHLRKASKTIKNHQISRKIMISTGPGARSFILVTQTSRKVSTILLDVVGEFLKILGRFDDFCVFWRQNSEEELLDSGPK